MTPSSASVTPGTCPSDDFDRDWARLEHLASAAVDAESIGGVRAMPGNALFLAAGQVLCRARARGDSRYVYGNDGFHFWVNASGYMSANRGRFFVFLPTGEGHEPRIAFFCSRRRSESFVPLPLLPVPFLREAEGEVRDRYAIISHEATYFHARTDDLASTVRVFLHQSGPQRTDLIFTIRLQNLTAENLELLTSAYFDPLCRNQFGESSEDRWFKQIRVAPPSAAPGAKASASAIQLPTFVVEVNEDLDRFRSITQRAWLQRLVSRTPVRAENCTSRRAYTGGPTVGLAQAAFLTYGGFTNPPQLTVFNDHAVAGDLNVFTLAPGETLRLDYVFSVQTPDAAANPPALSPAWIAQARHAAAPQAAEDRHVLRAEFEGGGPLEFGRRELNYFLPYLRRQVEVCAHTHGYMQPAPNSLVGIRDVFQALEGSLYDDPGAARRKMCEALEYVLPDGRCPRQYAPFGAARSAPADLREFVDQGCWVISAVHTYLQVTGDAAFLERALGYAEIGSGPGSCLVPSSERDSVLDHLVRIMDFLIRHCDPHTGLLRALYGDWNDALDGLGTTSVPDARFGSGVSVMASLQLYQNCAEMSAIFRQYRPGSHGDLLARYAAVRRQLRDGLLRYAVVAQNGGRRIVHGWGDARRYFVGSYCDSDGLSRDGLTSNAFWVLSGMLAEDSTLREEILAAFERLDSPFGMRTFAPGFAPDAPGVGRIPKLPIGTAENAGVYIHATLFGVAALFAMGEPQKAWAQIGKILPFARHHTELSHSPFVMPNSYVYNPALNLTGQNMNDWQTGSSNVLLKTLIRYVFGFRPEFEQLRIAPAGWSPFGEGRFRGQAHGRIVEIHYRTGDASRRRFLLNDQPWTTTEPDPAGIPAALIPYANLRANGVNRIEVIDG